MHIHILGICGTFMGSLAMLARQAGHRVSGSDANVYPPMSTQLQEQGIELAEGFHPDHLQPAPDLVIIGNALSRGNPAVEYVLNEGLEFTSGPHWLAHAVLPGKWVLAAAGTHGKTTTSAMLAWILQYAGMQPGYLIGGVSNNFPRSADLGDSDFFVVEADEYDSAFFDKRSKFIHYTPRTLILNNLEFDHEDIFEDMAAIEKQVHHLVRTVPGNGLIISPHEDAAIERALAQGCWTPRQQLGVAVADRHCRKLAADGVFWNIQPDNPEGSAFTLTRHGGAEAVERVAVQWESGGLHNIKNAAAAVAAAHHAGVGLAAAGEALQAFKGVKRRMELRGTVGGISVYDDFAHHPTAIAGVLEAMAAKLKAQGDGKRLIAVIEPRSATMKSGIHQQALGRACRDAGLVIWRETAGCKIDFPALVAESAIPAHVFADVDEIVAFLVKNGLPGDQVVIMSNGGFDGIHDSLLQSLEQAQQG